MVSYEPALSCRDAFDPKRNSFAFLRFLFASLVILAHAYPLGGFPARPFEGFSRWQESWGGFAVAGFFVLSGFLITRSYTTSPSPWRFIWHRVLRIFPGFLVCLVFTAFVAAPLLYLRDTGGFTGFLSLKPWRYLAANGLLRHRLTTLGNLPALVPYPGQLNASLWTLDYEFRCYLAVAVLGACGMLARCRSLVLGAFLFLWGVFVLNRAVPGAAAGIVPWFADAQLVRLSTLFFAGAVLFLYADRVPFTPGLAALAAVVLVVSLRERFYHQAAPFAVTYLVLWLGVKVPLANFGRWGDLSYGLYLYGFPVEQLLAAARIHRAGLVVYLSVAFLMTLGLAALSWRYVEEPCLRLKNVNVPSPAPVWNIVRNHARAVPLKIREFALATRSTARPAPPANDSSAPPSTPLLDRRDAA
jgi:peptidoglycan/LPS O-acetylase OafA/YrhL